MSHLEIYREVRDPVSHYELTTNSARGVLVFLPAMGVRAGFYRNTAIAFANEGYHCYVLELRGHGISPTRPSRANDHGYGEILDDVASLLTQIRRKYPTLSISLAGHSLGGQLAMLYASRYPEQLSRVLVVAAGTPHYSCYEGSLRHQLKIAPALFRLLSLIFGYYPGKRVGFGGNQARTLMREWCYLAKHNLFSLSSDPFDYELALASMRLPIDSFCFDGDTFGPRAAAYSLVSRCRSADLQFEELDTQSLGFEVDHFKWVEHSELLVPLFLKRF